MLRTERLDLIPNDPRWLLALTESAERFAEVSGLRPAAGLRDFFVGGDVPAAFLESLRAAQAADPWIHGFAAVLRDTGTVIANGGLKGPPDADGVAEIAYGVVPSFQNQGYATEVADALARFAADDDRVRMLRAHTLPEPNASTRVLTKLGFTFVGEIVDPEDGPVWRWERALEIP